MGTQVDRGLSARQKMFARYVSELALVEYVMLQFKASLVAASCICMAKVMVPQGRTKAADPWPAILACESRYQLWELEPCMNMLNMILLTDMGRLSPASLALNGELMAVREKYTHKSVRSFVRRPWLITHHTRFPLLSTTSL